VCQLCLATQGSDRLIGPVCGHLFCTDCCNIYFEFQITQRNSTGIACMAQKCEILAPGIRDKYQQLAFRCYVESHPQLRFCPGHDCQVVLRAKEPRAKRSICNSCKTTFSFLYGTN
jgi:ariadne-2